MTPRTEAELKADLRTLRRSLPTIVGPNTAELWLAFGRIERALGISGAAGAALAALREAVAWIDTYEDALGHGYCATQSGEYEDPCTCGFQEKRDRWEAVLSGAAPAAGGE